VVEDTLYGVDGAQGGRHARLRLRRRPDPPDAWRARHGGVRRHARAAPACSPSGRA
jgi:hypothetical protein